MIATALRWKVAEWTRSYPGRYGLLALASAPLGFFVLPVEASGFFGGRTQAVMVIYWLASLGIAAIFGRSSGQVQRDTIWVFQKSAPVVDWVMARWLLDLAAALLIASWWGLLALAVLAGDPVISLRDAAGTVVSGLVLVTLSMALLLALSSVAVNAADFFIIIVMIASARTLLAKLLPTTFDRLLMAFPPIPEAAGIGSLLVGGTSAWLGHAAYVVSYAAGCSAIAFILLKDRSPPL